MAFMRLGKGTCVYALPLRRRERALHAIRCIDPRVENDAVVAARELRKGGQIAFTSCTRLDAASVAQVIPATCAACKASSK
eukprot:6203007-Pleurochrysis_carterae.AAC.2